MRKVGTKTAIRRVAFSIAMIAMLAATPAFAAEQWHPRIELGLTLGYTMFDEVTGLGDAFFKHDVAEDAPTIGIRAGYQLSESLSIEGDFGFLSSKLPDDEFSKAPHSSDVTVLNWQLQARYKFMTRQRVSPFLGIGAGQFVQDANKKHVRDNDADPMMAITAGAEVKLGFRLRGRLDLRWLPAAGRPDRVNAETKKVEEDGTAVTNNMQVLVGLTYLIGGPPEDSDHDGIPNATDKCPNKAEDKDGWLDKDGCPELDNDDDKIPDTADKCPNEAEDKDGYKDDDGCPEPDNDGDGIPDASDKCTDKAEDKDGYKDNDGCPDPDNDGDKILDARDKCPNKAEDKDGFKDGDGCPDPDNDGDRILDAADKCPNKAETYNGVSDKDGCPDKLPDHVAKLFDGPLRGVKFGRKNKLKRKSSEVLEKLLELLLENEAVKIEIHAHADGKGKPAKLKATSMARATAIRKFYEDAGIDSGRFVLFAHGNAKPLVEGKSRKARKKNNRIELKIHQGK